MSRPTADAQEFRQVFSGKRCVFYGCRLSAKESAQGDLAGGAAKFREGHRAQPKAAYPPGPGVVGCVVGGNRRAGQNELIGRATLVNGPPDVVPKDRSELPFVN